MTAKSESGDESTMNKTEYVDGNSIIRINEHFPSTGKQLAACIESDICNEHKHNKDEQAFEY